MSESEVPSTGGGANKVLTIRTTEDNRAQLEVLALLNERSVAEETRVALEDWVERSKSDPTVLKRAEDVRAEIERDAETKRNAIAAVLGGGAKASARTSKQTPLGA